jgi:hypothetical protein
MTVEPGSRTLAGSNQSSIKKGSRLVTRFKWYTVPDAAKRLEISEQAVHKRVAAKALTGVEVGDRWRVLLQAEPGQPLGHEAEPLPITSESNRAASTAMETVPHDSLLSFLRDVHRESLTLAGRIGYLEAQLVATQDEVQRLIVSSGLKREDAREQAQGSRPIEQIATADALAIECSLRQDADRRIDELEDLLASAQKQLAQLNTPVDVRPVQTESIDRQLPQRPLRWYRITSYIQWFLAILSIALLIAAMLVSAGLRDLAMAPLNMDDLRRLALVLVFVLTATALRHALQANYSRIHRRQ